MLTAATQPPDSEGPAVPSNHTLPTMPPTANHTLRAMPPTATFPPGHAAKGRLPHRAAGGQSPRSVASPPGGIPGRPVSRLRTPGGIARDIVSAMSVPLPPGWYPVPGSPTAERWWDGIRWTSEIRDAEQTADPNEVASPDGTGDARVIAAGPPEAPVADGPAAAAGPQQAAPASPGKPGKPGKAATTRATWRLPAVEAWESRTAGQPPPRRRLPRWLGRSAGGKTT